MLNKDRIRIPYRCPHCHAVLARELPSNEVAAIQTRHRYTCGVCRAWMPATQVESGQLDIQTESPDFAPIKGSGPHEFRDLVAYLRRYHGPQHVYRGQTKMWKGPLVPSLYRGRVSEQPAQPSPNLRLRELGSVFHAVAKSAPETSDQGFVRRIQFNAQLHQVFGYPFGSMVAQQCGVTSEGLDVSHDPAVAAFFAIFDFAHNTFLSEGTGVIYRIRVPDEQTGRADLKAASFFDCPSVVSALVVFLQLRRVRTWKEAIDSFVEFGRKSLGNRGSPRPLHLLALPEDEVGRCRVVQQRAALLLPDLVLPREYNEAQRNPPVGKADWDGPLLVEDVARRPGVETFIFRHDAKNKYCLTQSPDVLFPRVDGVTKMLRTYFAANPQTLFATEFGVVGGSDTELIR